MGAINCAPTFRPPFLRELAYVSIYQLLERLYHTLGDTSRCYRTAIVYVPTHKPLLPIMLVFPY
jgi:hypothetical protein